LHIQADKCGSQTGTELWEVVFDEHGIGGGSPKFGTENENIPIKSC
jgi:hypothetical protein